MKLVNITIDGQNLTVSNETTILEAAKSVGIDIPALCYDSSLEIFGACRMCIVEIEGSSKLQTSCATLARDGMVIYTETDRVVQTRKEILQMLLDSHPNDCLTCQKAGTCLLQEYAYRYSVVFREHDGAVRPYYKDTTSPYIARDNSKCILCGKCVLSCAQIEDRKVLSFANRGYETKVVFGADEDIEKSPCVSCNRCVSVCPVGALVDKREVGKIRPWEGETRVVTCKACDYGCEFNIVSKNKKAIFVSANKPSNGRPLCLKGRLMTELKYLEKPLKPYRKIGDEFKETTWAKVLGIHEVLEKMNRLDSEEEN